MNEKNRPVCEACQNGDFEPWETWSTTLDGLPNRLLWKALATETKRAINCYLANCSKHLPEAEDRRDFVLVLIDKLIIDVRSAETTEVDVRGKMLSTQWIEGRRKMRQRRDNEIGVNHE
jgi:hypothetical protein